MRNSTFCKSGFSRLIFLIVFLLFTAYNASAQFYTKHYIAPAPWQYFSKANEIVISTNSLTNVDITVAKSDGTTVTTLKAKKGSPAVYRFSLLARDLPMNALNTVLNGAGLIITSTGPTAVNLRNIASDDYKDDENRDANIKGNAALTSFGDAGLGIRFRVGYYRDGSLGTFSTFGEQRPIYSIMATANNTTIKINNAVKATLNQGQSYLFKAPIGTLVESSNPIVMNTSAAIDVPGGCGDGAYNQIPPESVLGTEYFLERGTGNDTAEQTTVVATKDDTNITVESYSTTGVLVNRTTINLASAGSFHTFINGVKNTSFTASRIIADKRVAVYSGTAQNCEVDISTIAPVSECGGSEFVETSKFKNYKLENLDYFGYILLRSATEDVTINGVKTTSISGVGARYQIGSTGWYIINFNSEQIGRPEVLSIESKAKLTVSIVQQAGGFSMAGFFSTFAALPDDPTLTYIEGGGCTNNTAKLTTQSGYDPYQWYYNGVAINGANSSTYIATKTGNYSVSYTLACGAQTPSKTASVTLCTDLGITKTVDNAVPCIGSNVEFSVKVSNLGGNNVSGISVTDLLPSGYTYVSSTPSVGVYDATTGIWTIGDVEAQTSMTLKIVATVNASGNYTNTASLPSGIDSNTANNSASAAVNPKSANLVITNPAAVCAPSTINLTASAVTGGSSSNLTLTYWTNQGATSALSSPNAVTASGTYYIKAVSADGCTFIKPVVVTINPRPSTPKIIVSSGSLCTTSGNTVLKAENIASSYNGSSFLWSNGATTQSITITAEGTYTLQIVNSSGCVSISSDPVTVYFSPAPTVSDQTFCSSENKTVGDLIATGSNIKWYSSTNSNNNTPLSSNQILVNKGNYYATQTLNGCESSRVKVIVTINDNSSAPVAAASQSFCAADNSTINNLQATGANLKWYGSSSSNTELQKTQALTNGDYYVSQKVNSSCAESARTKVTVTINAIPSAPAVSSQTFCINDNKKVNDLTPSGSAYKWYSAATGGTLYTGNETLSSGNYYVSQSNNCGESSRTQVAVIVNTTDVPTVSAQTFCSGDLKRVNNLSPSGTSYKWYSASTGGTLYTGTETLVTGTYYVSQTANGCESLRRAVSVTVNETPAAPTAVAQAFCSGDNKTVNDLKVISGSNLKWYNASTGGTLYLGSEILTSGNYFVSQTANSCESTRTLVGVTVNPTPATPSISADGATTFCQGGTVTLKATGGSSYLWSTGATTQSITVSASGDYSVQVTNDSGCPSAFSTPVTIKVNPIPSAPTASAQTFCSSENKKVSDLTVTSGSNLKWYAAATGGSALDLTEVLTTKNYFVTQTSSGYESTRTSVSVVVNQTPSAPTALAQAFCSSENKKVGDLKVTSGSNLKWYAASTGGSELDLTEVLTTKNYYVSQTSNGCESSRTSVSVTVNSLPTATITGNLTACLTTTLTANSDVTTVTYVWYKDNAIISSQTNKTLTVTQDGDYKVKITNTSTGCEQTSATSTVKVSDTEKPSITCPATVTVSADANSCVATGVALGTPTTSDNCTGTVTVTNNAPSSFPIGNTTVTWTAQDAAGNTQTCTQTVTVNDTEKPSITCPATVTVSADANSCVATGVALGTPTTSDNCTGTVTVTNNAPSSFPIGNTTVTWTAQDAAGNTQTCTQTVTVNDTEKPSITCPATVTVSADANSCVATGVALGTPTTSDNCTGTVTVTNNAPSSFPIGNTTVTWTAQDAAGNTQTCTQTVTVNDTEKPSITCPATVTVSADANSCVATGVALGTPTTSDNCTGTVTVTNNAPSSFPIGNTTVTWTAQDAAGNTQTCTQTVTVNDTEKPSITCPATVTVSADANSCVATGVALGTPTTSDNCTGTVTVTNNAPSSFPIGNTTVTWTAQDAAGNTQTCTQTVTVNDTEKPSITCLATVTVSADANSCVATGVALGTPTTSDNCTGTVMVTNNAPSSFPIGNTTVTWTAKDAAGNTQTCTQTVTVNDTEKPSITCPATVTVSADANSCVATGVALGTPTTSDNCTGTVMVTNNAPSSFPIGNTTVTWTAKDAAGNTQTCTQTVTVNDTEKPSITCPATVTVSADANSCVATGVALGTPTTSDNCTGTVTVTNNAPSSFPIGNTTVTWTAQDAAGNTQTCTQTVTVNDTEKPSITCPATVTVSADANSCVATGVALGTPTTSDNCTGTVMVTNNAPSSFPIGNTTVTWTAKDAAGNIETCTQTVKVIGAIIANDDTISSSKGVAGGVVISNIFDNDDLNCNKVNINDVDVKLTSSLPSVLTFNSANGAVSVKPNTPTGTYTFDYSICEIVNNGNCDSATVTIEIVNDLVAIKDDFGTTASGATAVKIGNVKTNDTLDGIAVNDTNTVVTIGSDAPLSVDANGDVTLAANTPSGTYTITYEICENGAAPANCKTATAEVKVVNTIDAVLDTIDPINGNIGGTTVSLIGNDTLNGKQAVIGINSGEVAINIVGTLPSGLTLNASGTITVAPNTQKGNYNIEYRICEIGAVPANCDSVTITVPVTAGNLVANADAIPSVLGSDASQTLGKNVFDNDTKNAQPLDPADVTLKTLTPDPKGYLTVDKDGNIVLGANPPAGEYELTYEICEKLNPDNCSSNTVKVTVGMPVIDAVEDVIASINGNIGGKTISLIANDKLNGNAIVVGTAAGEVKFEIIGTLPAGLTLSSDHTITVAPNTPKGDYKVEYKICEINNPLNCDSAIITVPVTAGNLVANADAIPSVLGSDASQTLGKNVFDNDTKNAQPLDPADVTLKTLTPDPKGYLTVDKDGNIVLGANPPAGEYELTYEICEKLNPDNCSSNTVKVTVGMPVIDAVEDVIASINGNIGGKTISLIANDKLNGNAIVVGTAAGEVKFEIIGTLPAGLTLSSDHTITVAPNTPKGDYKVEYKICEINNPLNCDSAIITVPVTAGNLVANADAIPSVLGSDASQTLGKNVFDNDTKNAQPLDPADVTLKTLTPDPKGYLTVDKDGNIVLGANPPAGEYELTYEICEKLNPDNCSSNTVKVTVGMPVIDAVEDVIASINGNIGGKTISLIANDKLNGNAIVVGTAAGEVKFEIIGTLPSGFSLNPDYTIAVAPNTPKGDYKVEYKICEITNTTNCDSVTITVPVTAGNLVANADAIPSVLGSDASQTLGKNVFDNDTKNAQPLDPADVTLKTLTPDPKGYLTVDKDGNIVLGANPPAGEYELTYEICEKLNPDNCSSNTVKVTVGMPVIDAVEDVIASINGNIGGKTISLIANDKLNGNAIVVGTAAGEVKFEIIGTLPSGLSLNPDYTIGVAPNTPKGDYKVEYKICEINNPLNCDSVIITVPVTGSKLLANEDLVPAVGVNIPQKVINVFDNDTKDGKKLVPSDVNLTVTKADPKGYLTLDADGNVSLAPNAPAGEYELTYTICEKLNQDNCDSNVVKVTVTEPKMTIVANSYCSNNVPYVKYTVTPDNFAANNLLTVKWIDGNNNVVATQTDLPLNGDLLWPGAEVDSNGNGIDWPGWVLNNGIWTEGADGFEATRNGVKIEFSLNPTVTVSVAYPPATPDCNARPTFSIKANNDETGPVNVKKGASATVNIFENDVLNGAKIKPSDVVLSVPVVNPNFSLNANGSINIAANTPDGVYELIYQICEAANTSNCSQAVIKIIVDNVADPAPPTVNEIVLNNDNDVSADGINGSLEFVNVLDNDLINGKPINPADVVVKPVTSSPYFEWNADGTVNVKPNTPGGNYPLTYQVCEKGNNTNCSTATLNVFVEVPSISVIKTAVFNDENKSSFANAGETITYKFTVTNTGNVPLVGITINDPLPGVVVSGQAISLAVNESNETNFTAVYKITQEDINRGSVSNQATVKGSSVRGVVVEDESDDASNNGDNPTVLDLNGCSIKVMNAFSPNGDSKNARFYIRGIECYPDNTVEIYNRWGVLVFTIDQYNNNDRVFVGYSNGRSTIKQTDGLPVGTYFYVLKYKDSAQKSHQESGYLYLNK
ncbi:HYR domain-containing protein [Flavobacterium anhuiense]|uniref:HYR domain-containing protein n=1 Tax=Flavobacterium anhuiense TaxID=459526 RepID=UPI003D95BD6F